LPVHPSDDQLRVRVFGIVMIDRRPFDAAPQVPARPAPSSAARTQVELRGVFRRDNEPKLVGLAETRRCSKVSRRTGPSAS
jgi:hypothetical protein